MMDEWRRRQATMEGWYRQLGSDAGAAAEDLLYEYMPHADGIATMHGRILDVGGGAGLAGAFLPEDAEYVVLDPSAMWQEPVWDRVAGSLGSRRRTPRFIRGVGEAVPFPAESFDGALAFWSLNHAADAAAVVREVHRVLRPGSVFMAILEDVEPELAVLARYAMMNLLRRLRLVERTRVPRKPVPALTTAFTTRLLRREWPLQHDHVRITEAEFRHWLQGRFRVVERSWDSGFLTYRLERC